jgi:hypothetical protein
MFSSGTGTRVLSAEPRATAGAADRRADEQRTEAREERAAPGAARERAHRSFDATSSRSRGSSLREVRLISDRREPLAPRTGSPDARAC